MIFRSLFPRQYKVTAAPTNTSCMYRREMARIEEAEMLMLSRKVIAQIVRTIPGRGRDIRETECEIASQKDPAATIVSKFACARNTGGGGTGSRPSFPHKESQLQRRLPKDTAIASPTGFGGAKQGIAFRPSHEEGSHKGIECDETVP